MYARPFARSALAMVTILLLGATSACGSDDATGPDMSEVAATYTATTFTVNVLGTEHDMLEAGASIVLTLSEDGTCSGHLFVPATDLSDEVDADLAGTWTLSGNTVTVSQSADTFLRDIDLEVDSPRLIGNGTFDGAMIHVELDPMAALGYR
jgi:hypothetical protein